MKWMGSLFEQEELNLTKVNMDNFVNRANIASQNVITNPVPISLYSSTDNSWWDNKD